MCTLRARRGAGIAGIVWVERDSEGRVFRWLKRRRLGGATQRRLTIAMAHAEEQLLETHVHNVLEMHDALASELPIADVLELYLDEYERSEQRSEIVVRRVLAQLAAEPRRRDGPRRRLER